MSGAHVSICGRFRFRLDRNVTPDGTCPRLPEHYRVLFIGVNPSTADATFDDPTIRRMMGFALRWGFSKMTVANLFSLRATDPLDLATFYRDSPDARFRLAGDLAWIKALAAEPEVPMIVPCWGSINKIPRWLRHQRDEAVDILRKTPGEPLICHLGPLVGGTEPGHPLFLPYTTELRGWEL